MKQFAKILSMLIVTAIYCYAVNVAGNHTYSIQADNTTQGSSFAELDFNSFTHTFQAESSIRGFSNFSSDSLKNLQDSLHDLLQINAGLFSSIFTCYLRCTKNLQLNFGSTDIIFPFHYFL